MALPKITCDLKNALEYPERHPELSEDIKRINELTREYFSEIIGIKSIKTRDVSPFERCHTAEMCILEKRKLEVLFNGKRKNLSNEEEACRIDAEIDKIISSPSNEIFDGLLAIIVKINNLLSNGKKVAEEDYVFVDEDEEDYVEVEENDIAGGLHSYQVVEKDIEQEDGYDYIPSVKNKEQFIDLDI